MLIASFYFEYYEHLQPCALCLMQRFMLFVLFLLFGFEVFSKKRAVLLTSLQVFFSALGMYFALRQVWLQMLPEDAQGACLPNIFMVIQYMPFQDVIKALFLGSKDCSVVSWQWLGITMPGWSAMYFTMVFLVTLFMLIKLTRLKNTA